MIATSNGGSGAPTVAASDSRKASTITLGTSRQTTQPSRGYLRLREHALTAVQQLTDGSTFQQVGLERMYAKRQGTKHMREYVSAEPAHPLDAALALLDWREYFSNDEEAHQLTALAAGIGRGITSDFSVTATSSGAPFCKGAFWECLTLDANHRVASSCDLRGGGTVSISATAAIAEGLFRLHERTGDEIALNSALRAAEWLLLKLGTDGGYSGDRIIAATNDLIPGITAGIDSSPAAAGAMIYAFRATGREIYAQAAARALRHAAREINLVTTSSATVNQLAKNAAILYAESASVRNLRLLDQASSLLRESLRLESLAGRTWRCGASGLNCATAALDLFFVLGDDRWMKMALDMLSANSVSSFLRPSEAIPWFLNTMLALPALIAGCRPDLRCGHVRVGWTTYAADPATRGVIDVEPCGANQAGGIDFLPLVSMIGRSVLIPVLASTDVAEIQIRSGARLPNLTDLITGEIVCQPAHLHTLPFASDSKWGCFVIDH